MALEQSSVASVKSEDVKVWSPQWLVPIPVETSTAFGTKSDLIRN